MHHHIINKLQPTANQPTDECLLIKKLCKGTLAMKSSEWIWFIFWVNFHSLLPNNPKVTYKWLNTLLWNHLIPFAVIWRWRESLLDKPKYIIVCHMNKTFMMNRMCRLCLPVLWPIDYVVEELQPTSLDARCNFKKIWCCWPNECGMDRVVWFYLSWCKRTP